MSSAVGSDANRRAETSSDIIKGANHVASFPGRHQYAIGGVSSCGLAALNCVRVILSKERAGVSGMILLQTMMERETFEEILRICLGWESAAHLDVDDIYKAPIFSQTLKHLWSEFNTPSFDAFKGLLEHLQRSSPGSAAAVVITRPPEIISVLKVVVSGKPTFAVFDSHPRSNHPDGAAFVFNSSIDATANYLNELLRFDASIIEDRSLQWQAQLLANYCGHAYVLNRHISPDEWEEAALESSLAVLQLQDRLQAERRDKDSLKRDVTRLEEEVQQLEMQVENFKKEKRRADKLLQSSRYPGSNQGPPRGSSILKKVNNTTPSQVSTDVSPFSSSISPSASFSQGASTSSYRQPNHSSYAAVANTSRSGQAAMDREALNYATRLQREYDEENEMHIEIHQSGVTREEHITSNGKGKSPTHPYDLRAAIISQPGALDSSSDYQSLQYASQLQHQFEQENEALIREAKVLQQTLSTFNCGICMEECSREMVAQLESCGHSFCRECVREYVCSKIKDQCFPIVCPLCGIDKDREHPGTLDSRFVQHLGISEREYATFEEMELAAFSVMIHCRKCNSTAFVDRAELQEAKLVTCPLPGCTYIWCKTCSQPIDFEAPQHSCDGSSELNHLMGKRGWKHCPGCQTPTEKVDGCNHMTCVTPGCNTHFCWVCGQSIVKSINRREIKNAVSSHYRRCQLFRY